jgi:hypothetical protein
MNHIRRSIGLAYGLGFFFFLPCLCLCLCLCLCIRASVRVSASVSPGSTLLPRGRPLSSLFLLGLLQTTTRRHPQQDLDTPQHTHTRARAHVVRLELPHHAPGTLSTSSRMNIYIYIYSHPSNPSSFFLVTIFTSYSLAYSTHSHHLISLPALTTSSHRHGSVPVLPGPVSGPKVPRTAGCLPPLLSSLLRNLKEFLLLLIFRQDVLTTLLIYCVCV